MSAGPQTEDRMVAHFAPQDSTAEPGCVLPMARMLLANGVPPARMGLIRWDRLRPLLGQRWDEVAGGIYKLVFTHVRDILGAEAVCLRFDETSALVVARDDTVGHVAVATAVRRTLFGALSRDELVEVWTVRAADGDGLSCGRAEELAAPTPKAAPAPAPVAAAVAAPVHHSVVLTDTDFSYLPLWEVRRNFVFFYACEPFWTLPDGAIAREADVRDQFVSPHHVVALDSELLRNVAEVLADVMEHDRMAQVLVPVHYSTLAGEASATRYSSEARQSAYELKERAFLEIVGLPEDIDAARLRDMVNGLRGLCRDVCVRVDFDTRLLPVLAEARVFAVGFNLRGDNRREADIIADLESFAGRAAAANVRCYAHGIRTTSLGVAAACSGVDFLGTEALAATLEGCALDDYVVKPIDLYKRIARRKG